MAVAGSSMGIGPIFSAPANGNQAPPVGKKNNCVHSAAGLQVLQDFGGSSMLMFVLKGEKNVEFWQDMHWSGMFRLNLCCPIFE